MGWMPTAVDLSTWNSLWTVEKIQSTKYHPSLKETLSEFNFGYIISGLLSIMFMTMGAFLIFKTENKLPVESHLFANQVVNLYTKVFGSWSYIIIASSTFSIMFGTCIAVFDGYSRSVKKTFELVTLKYNYGNRLYNIILLLLLSGTFVIICKYEYSGNFIVLVNFATALSFIVAPVIAVFNYLVIKKQLPNKFQPPKWLKLLSLLGIFYLISFSIIYIILNLENL